MPICFSHTPPRPKKEHFLCIQFPFFPGQKCICVCVFMGGLGQSSGKTQIPCVDLLTLREKLWFTKSLSLTHTHTLKHRLYQIWPWPDLPTGSPTHIHKETWETGNRKWALSKHVCESSVNKEWCMKTHNVCKDRRVSRLMPNNVNCFNC